MKFSRLTSLGCATATHPPSCSRNNSVDGILRVDHIITLNQDNGPSKAAEIVITNH